MAAAFDSGSFESTAFEVVGSGSGPVITTQPTNQSAASAGTATFSFSATGYSTAQWQTAAPIAFAQAAITGTPANLTLSTSATPGAQSITVPSDAEGVLFFWSAYAFDLSSLTSNFTDTFTLVKTGNDGLADGVGVAYARVTSTGSKTVTPVWGGAQTNGPVFWTVFVKNIPASGTWVRGYDTQHSPNDPSSALVGTVSSTTTDVVIAYDEQFQSTVPAAESGWTSLGTVTVNNYNSRLSKADSPGASTTSFSGNGTAYPVMGLVSIISRPAGFGAWTNVSTGSGGTTSSWTTGTLSLSDSGYKVRALLDGSLATNEVTLTVTSGAVITCAVGAAAAAGVSAQVSATLATAVAAAAAAGVGARVSATLATAVGAATAAGVSAQVSVTLATAVAAASATGASASISTAGSTVITCAVGAATAAGVSAQVSATLATAVATASATGVGASISAAGNTVIPCTVAAASATGVNASISTAGSTVITCAVGAAAAAGVSARVSATLVTSVAAASATGTSASISTPGSTVITCAVGAAAAVGVAAQVSAAIKAGVGAAAAAGVSAATGLRLAATVANGAAIGVLAQLQLGVSTAAGAAAATGVPYIPRSSNDILPGALVGNRPYVDTTRPAQEGAARPMQQGAVRPMQQGAARPSRATRTTR